MITQAARKAQLIARLAQLDSRVHGIDAELQAEHAADWEDLACEREGDEVLEGVGISALHEIRMIKAALQRLQAGDFGSCTKCGEPISEDRLDLLPFTPFCRSCAV